MGRVTCNIFRYKKVGTKRSIITTHHIDVVTYCDLDASRCTHRIRSGNNRGCRGSSKVRRAKKERASAGGAVRKSNKSKFGFTVALPISKKCFLGCTAITKVGQWRSRYSP